MGARIGGGRVSIRPSTPPPPPLEKIFRYRLAFLLLVLHVGVFLQRFFYLWGGIYVDLFCSYGDHFLACHLPPPPMNISAGAQEYRYGIATD